MASKVGIIVLNWNGLADTNECVASILHLTYTHWHLWLIDNGSRDQQYQALQAQWGSDARITIIGNNTNSGFSGGMNQGIDLALADSELDRIFLLNNDAVCEPDCLDHLQASLTDEWIGGAAATMQDYTDHTQPNAWGLQITTAGLGFVVTRAHQKFFCPSGGAVLYTRRFIEYLLQTDGYFFDPEFFAYAEDLDVGFRGHWYGFSFVRVPAAVVYHRGQSSARRQPSHFAMEHYLCNGLWVLIKNWTGTMWWRWGWRVAVSRLVFAGLYVGRGAPGVPWRAYGRAIRGLRVQLARRRRIQHYRTRAPADMADHHVGAWLVR